MAKLEKTLRGDFDYILKVLDIAVLQGSASASYEDGSDYSQGGFRCSVRIYERYSYTGYRKNILRKSLPKSKFTILHTHKSPKPQSTAAFK